MSKIKQDMNPDHESGQVYIYYGAEVAHAILSPFKTLCSKIGLQVNEIEDK